MPSLSVCLVTRNEEANLPRVLRSVAGLADEVLVAETGSTDRTATLAAELGASVRPFTWDDDFAAARNFALEQARGDWVLWLNPDEELTPESPPAVRAALALPGALGYAVRVHDLPRADQPKLYSELIQVRLFRRLPEVRFAGRLHPVFAPPLAEIARRHALNLSTAPAVIRRHGYLNQPTPDKLRWAARLLGRELADRPGQLHYLVEYGKTLLLLNDVQGHTVLGEAADLLWRERDAPAPSSPTAGQLLDYLMTVRPEERRGPIDSATARSLAEHWFAASPPLVWRLAECDFQAGNYREAARHLERLTAMGRTGEYDRSASFDPSILGGSAWTNLGGCYLKLGDLDAAERCYRAVLHDPLYRAGAGRGLELVRRLRTP